MKKVFIISQKPFLEETLNSAAELSGIIGCTTHKDFKAGADLYITEHGLAGNVPQLLIQSPLKLSHLIERVKSFFNNSVIQLDARGEFALNIQKRLVIVNGREINLTEVECAILKHLHEVKDKVQSKEELASR